MSASLILVAGASWLVGVTTNSILRHISRRKHDEPVNIVDGYLLPDPNDERWMRSKIADPWNCCNSDHPLHEYVLTIGDADDIKIIVGCDKFYVAGNRFRDKRYSQAVQRVALEKTTAKLLEG
jgi:hypothetical protein